MVFKKLFKKKSTDGGKDGSSVTKKGAPLQPLQTTSNTSQQEYSDEFSSSSSANTEQQQPLNKLSSSNPFRKVGLYEDNSQRQHPRSPSSLISNPNIPKELVPIITLIQLQQARIYFDGYIRIEGKLVNSTLRGSELVYTDPTLLNLTKTTYNIADAIFQYNKLDLILEVVLTSDVSFVAGFDSETDLNNFYSSILLSQFEYHQLQESFTGLLLSAKGAMLSDIRTILAPENRFIKTEWCVLKFPFLSDKWIRCYVVVVPGEKTLMKNSTSGLKEKPGKIEIYTSSRTSKKHLLATIINGRSCYSIYPEKPEDIDLNLLLHISGSIYINEEKFMSLSSSSTALELQSLVSHKRSTSSLNKFMSPKSPVLAANSPLPDPRSRSSSINFTYFQRSDSTQSLDSSKSSISKKLQKSDLLRTSLCLLIPETHPAVKQFDTMVRLLIPIMNVFRLYGRPVKFLSQRSDKHSLLFGLPQLPHTEYLDTETAMKLVELNIQNSVNENWNTDDWMQVFKEMISVKLTKGYKGSGNVFDSFKKDLTYTTAQRSDSDIYLSENELLDFIDMNGNNDPHSGLSTPRGTFINRSRSPSLQQLNTDLHVKTSSISSRLNSPLNQPTELEPSPLATNYLQAPIEFSQQENVPQQDLQQPPEYRAMLAPSGNNSARSPLQNEYFFDAQEDNFNPNNDDKYVAA